MPEKNLISWNTMMFGYLQIGRSLEANSLHNIRISSDFVDDVLTFFYYMLRSETKPDNFFYNYALTACGCSRALVQARAIHCGAFKRGFESDVGVGNALITAYGKCGNLVEADSVFKILSAPDIISWNALLMAYMQNGEGNKALNLFDEMRTSGVELNHVSFISLFSACSYTGEVNKGEEYFKEHYACMVDLLGKAGLLSEVEAIINMMPIEPNVTVWGALLGACKMHGDPLIGKRAVEQILILELDNVAAQIAMAETFAAKCMWREVEKSHEKPSGCEALPRGIISRTSNLEMRPMWNSPNYSKRKVTVDGNSYHRPYFNCFHGGCTISPSNYIAHDGKLYYKHLHNQLFMSKGNFSKLEDKHEEIRARVNMPLPDENNKTHTAKNGTAST